MCFINVDYNIDSFFISKGFSFNVLYDNIDQNLNFCKVHMLSLTLM